MGGAPVRRQAQGGREGRHVGLDRREVPPGTTPPPGRAASPSRAARALRARRRRRRAPASLLRVRRALPAPSPAPPAHPSRHLAPTGANHHLHPTRPTPQNLAFPNLPYLLHGDLKITQSTAIWLYLAELGGIQGSSPAQRARANSLLGVSNDLRSKCGPAAGAGRAPTRPPSAALPDPPRQSVPHSAARAVALTRSPPRRLPPGTPACAMTARPTSRSSRTSSSRGPSCAAPQRRLLLGLLSQETGFSAAPACSLRCAGRGAPRSWARGGSARGEEERGGSGPWPGALPPSCRPGVRPAVRRTTLADLETVLRKSGGPFLLGEEMTYVDLIWRGPPGHPPDPSTAPRPCRSGSRSAAASAGLLPPLPNPEPDPIDPGGTLSTSSASWRPPPSRTPRCSRRSAPRSRLSPRCCRRACGLPRRAGGIAGPAPPPAPRLARVPLAPPARPQQPVLLPPEGGGDEGVAQVGGEAAEQRDGGVQVSAGRGEQEEAPLGAGGGGGVLHYCPASPGGA